MEMGEATMSSTPTTRTGMTERGDSHETPEPRHEAIRTPYSLSVIIPAYNEGAAIERVLASVGAQLPDAELIVVDDASRDNTVELALRAGATVVQQPYNKGNGAAVK